jgi:hypothetical protein
MNEHTQYFSVLTCSISNGVLANLDLWNLKINIKYQIHHRQNHLDSTTLLVFIYIVSVPWEMGI